MGGKGQEGESLFCPRHGAADDLQGQFSRAHTLRAVTHAPPSGSAPLGCPGEAAAGKGQDRLSCSHDPAWASSPARRRWQGARGGYFSFAQVTAQQTGDEATTLSGPAAGHSFLPSPTTSALTASPLLTRGPGPRPATGAGEGSGMRLSPLARFPTFVRSPQLLQPGLSRVLQRARGTVGLRPSCAPRASSPMTPGLRWLQIPAAAAPRTQTW